MNYGIAFKKSTKMKAMEAIAMTVTGLTIAYIITMIIITRKIKK